MLVYSLRRYSASRGRVAAQIRGNTRLEIGWTLAAALILVVLTVITFVKLGAISNPTPASRPSRRPANRRASEPVTNRGRRAAVHLELPVSERGDSPTSRWSSPRNDDRAAGHRQRRRRALLVDPEAGRQSRRHAGLHEPHVVPHLPSRRVPRPVRRALRSQPRRHDRPRARRLPRRTSAHGSTRSQRAAERR